MTAWTAAVNGSRITKAGFPKAAYTEDDPLVRITADVYEAVPLDGAKSANQEVSRRIKFKAGQIVRQSVIDAMYPAITNVKILTATRLAPTALLRAGGDVLTIKADKGLLGVTNVAFAAANGTSLTVVDDRTITVTTPSQAGAGAVNVVLTDDAGTTTITNGVTYL